jgi:hypothetical protein
VQYQDFDSGVAKKFVLNPHGLIDNASRNLMTGRPTPVPVCTRPAAQGRTLRKGEVALPRSPFGVYAAASTGHAHPGTAAERPPI